MIDPFVTAAYATVAAGLLLYVASVTTRLRGARRTATALQRECHRVGRDRARAADAMISPEPTEGPP